MIKATPQPRVAVLLATHNGLRFLPEQLESLWQQVEVEITVFISDDMSTDGTWEWLSTQCQERLVILPRTGRFGSASQNFFRLLRDIDYGPFEFVAFCDQDDVWNSDKLANMILTMREKGADAASSSVTAFWPEGQEVLLRKNYSQTKWDYLFESAGPGCTYVFTSDVAASLSEAIKKNGQFTGKIALHDWLAYAWVRASGGKWCIVGSPTLKYRQHGANEFGANVGVKAIVSRIDKMRNDWYRSQILLIAQCIGMYEAWPIACLRRLNGWNRIKLAMRACQFRRRMRDKFVIGFAFFWMKAK